MLTYFVQDEKKSGGACHTARGKIRRIDPDAGQIILEDGMRIRLDCVVDIEFTGQLSTKRFMEIRYANGINIL